MMRNLLRDIEPLGVILVEVAASEKLAKNGIVAMTMSGMSMP